MDTASIGRGAPSVTEQSMDLEHIPRHRRHSLNSTDGLQEKITNDKVSWCLVVAKQDDKVIEAMLIRKQPMFLRTCRKQNNKS